nr:MAG TPA: Dam-replacing family [Caudoviricetes sp.]
MIQESPKDPLQLGRVKQSDHFMKWSYCPCCGQHIDWADEADVSILNRSILPWRIGMRCRKD